MAYTCGRIDNTSYPIILASRDRTILAPLINIGDINYERKINSFNSPASFDVYAGDDNLRHLTGDKEVLISYGGERQFMGQIDNISHKDKVHSVTLVDHASKLESYKIRKKTIINEKISDVAEELFSTNIAQSPATSVWVTREGDLTNEFNKSDRLIDGFIDTKYIYQYWYGGSDPQYAIVNLPENVWINKVRIFCPYWCSKESVRLTGRYYHYNVYVSEKDPYNTTTFHDEFTSLDYSKWNLIGDSIWAASDGYLTNTTVPTTINALSALVINDDIIGDDSPYKRFAIESEFNFIQDTDDNNIEFSILFNIQDVGSANNYYQFKIDKYSEASLYKVYDGVGTITLISGSPNVVGAGTQFQTGSNGVRPFDYIIVGSQWYMIASVTSDTALELYTVPTVNYNGSYQLSRVLNTTSTIKTLTNDIDDATNNIVVDNIEYDPTHILSRQFANCGDIMIGSELIHYGQIADISKEFTGCGRGMCGTNSVRHIKKIGLTVNYISGSRIVNFTGASTTADVYPGYVIKRTGDVKQYIIKRIISNTQIELRDIFVGFTGATTAITTPTVREFWNVGGYTSTKKVRIERTYDSYIQVHINGYQVFSVKDTSFYDGKCGIALNSTTGIIKNLRVNYFNILDQRIWELVAFKNDTEQETPMGNTHILGTNSQFGKYVKVEMTYDNAHFIDYDYMAGLADIAEIEIYTPLFLPGDVSNCLYNYIDPTNKSLQILRMKDLMNNDVTQYVVGQNYGTSESYNAGWSLINTNMQACFNKYWQGKNSNTILKNKAQMLIEFTGRKITPIYKVCSNGGMLRGQIFKEISTDVYECVSNEKSISLKWIDDQSEKNLVWNSDFSSICDRDDNKEGVDGWNIQASNANYEYKVLDDDGIKSLYVDKSALGVVVVSSDTYVIPSENKLFCGSIYLRGSGSVVLYMREVTGDGITASQTTLNINLTSDKRRYHLDITGSGITDRYIVMSVAVSTDSWFYMTDAQIERDEYTAYEPSNRYMTHQFSTDRFSFEIFGDVYPFNTPNDQKRIKEGETFYLLLSQGNDDHYEEKINVNCFSGYFYGAYTTVGNDNKATIFSAGDIDKIRAWENEASPYSSCGAYTKSRAKGDIAQFTFYAAKKLDLFCKRAPNCGNIKIRYKIKGGAWSAWTSEISTYSGIEKHPNVYLWKSNNLTFYNLNEECIVWSQVITQEGEYTIQVEVQRTKEQEATDYYVYIDSVGTYVVNQISFPFEEESNAQAIQEFVKQTGCEFIVNPDCTFDFLPKIGSPKPDKTLMNGKNILSSVITEDYKSIASVIRVKGGSVSGKDYNDEEISVASTGLGMSPRTYRKYGYREALIQDSQLYDPANIERRLFVATRELGKPKISYDASSIQETDINIGDEIWFSDNNNGYNGSLRVISLNSKINNRGLLEKGYKLNTRSINLEDFLNGIQRGINMSNNTVLSPFKQVFQSESMPLEYVRKPDNTYEKTAVILTYNIPYSVIVTKATLTIVIYPSNYRTNADLEDPIMPFAYPEEIRTYLASDYWIKRFPNNIIYWTRKGGLDVTGTVGGVITPVDSLGKPYVKILDITNMCRVPGMNNIAIESGVDINSFIPPILTDKLKQVGGARMFLEVSGISTVG